MDRSRPISRRALVVALAYVSALISCGAPPESSANLEEDVSGGSSSPNDLTAAWTPYEPSKEIQIETGDKIRSYPYSTTARAEAGASYNRSNAIETFKMFNHDASNRVEVRVLDDYTTGLRQFAGDVRFTAPLDNESLMQVFGEAGGSAMLMLRGYSDNGGTIRKVPGNDVVASGIYGTWVHVNVIHDATKNHVSVYINGKLEGTWDSGAVGPDRPFHYHKYGCYGTLKTATAQVEWRNVAFYKK